MKRILLPLTLCMFVNLVSSAQKIGIKAGGNFSNVVGSSSASSTAGSTESDKHMYVPGFHVGVLGEIDLSSLMSFQIEAVYSQKGFKQKFTSSNLIVTSTLESKNTYSYIDVPLLLNIHFGQMGSYLGIGPQISFLSGVKWDGTQTNTYSNSAPPPLTNTSTSFTMAGNDKTGYAKTDFGLVIGTGSKWDSGIEYCLRAAYGLTNVIDQSSSTSSAVWHNLVFSVSLGYTFGTGGGGQGDRYGRKYNSKTKHH